MLKICTVYFEGLYHPNAVSKLYRSLKENSTVPFEFVCLADRGVDADVVLPYNYHSNIKKHWHKLKYFSPQFAYQNPGDDIIIMDIDQQIVGNVDEILNYPVEEKELLTYDSWWNVKTNKFADRVIIPINGGFYKFKSGSFNYIWDDFSLNPEYWQLHYYNKGDVHYKYYGEQNYVFWKLDEHKANIIDDFDLLKEFALANKKQNVLDNWLSDNIDNTFIEISEELSTCSCYNKWMK